MTLDSIRRVSGTGRRGEKIRLVLFRILMTICLSSSLDIVTGSSHNVHHTMYHLVSYVYFFKEVRNHPHHVRKYVHDTQTNA